MQRPISIHCNSHFVRAQLLPSLSHYCCRIFRPVEEFDCNSRDTDIYFHGAERGLQQVNDYSVEMMDVRCLEKEELFPKEQK